MNQIQRIFERFDFVNREIEILREELKYSEILFYKADNIFDRREIELNMQDINTKISQLQLEEEHLSWVIDAIGKGGLMI